METQKIIGIITDFCEEHGTYAALFPSLDGLGVLFVEGDVSYLPLESQMLIDTGAGIIAEVSEEGEVLHVFCPPVETLELGFSPEVAENWLQKIRDITGIEQHDFPDVGGPVDPPI